MRATSKRTAFGLMIADPESARRGLIRINPLAPVPAMLIASRYMDEGRMCRSPIRRMTDMKSDTALGPERCPMSVRKSRLYFPAGRGANPPQSRSMQKTGSMACQGRPRRFDTE